MPDPILVRPSAPAPFCNTPLKLVELLSPPVVRTAAAALLLMIDPAPESEPTLFERPCRSSVAPLATVTAELLPNALVEAAPNAPALTVVAPV